MTRKSHAKKRSLFQEIVLYIETVVFKGMKFQALIFNNQRKSPKGVA
jgi:hypothetical protein